jgi:hypothetical protein
MATEVGLQVVTDFRSVDSEVHLVRKPSCVRDTATSSSWGLNQLAAAEAGAK